MLKIFNVQNGKHFVDLLADHMTKLRNFTKGKICEFSEFPFSLLLTFDQILTNLMFDDFTRTTYKSCTNELACCNGYIS